MKEEVSKEFNKVDSLIYFLAKTQLAVLLGKSNEMSSDIQVKYKIYLEPQKPFIKMKLNQNKINSICLSFRC